MLAFFTQLLGLTHYTEGSTTVSRVTSALFSIKLAVKEEEKKKRNNLVLQNNTLHG